MDYPKSVPNVGLVNGKFVDEDAAAGVVGSLIPSTWGNAVTDEILAVIKAAGITPSEGDSAQMLKAIRMVGAGVVGSIRNGKMVLTAAATSAVFSADEVILEAALGGEAYRLANLNKTLNLNTVGAGGMSSGTAPSSGFVAIYAIYNPSAGTSALLAVNATATAAPEVCSQANMPAGFLASALISVWPTNSNGQLVIGRQSDRSITLAPTVALSSTSNQATYLQLSLSSIIPKNATHVGGLINLTASASAGIALGMSPDTTNSGMSDYLANVLQRIASFTDIPLASPQNIYYIASCGATPSTVITINRYRF